MVSVGVTYLITGGHGMVGHAFRDILPDAVYISSQDYDLRDKERANAMMEEYEPNAVIHLAAKVGGVKANMEHMGDFYRDNILINTNVLEAAHLNEVNKVVSLLSTCVYPDKVCYPLTEEQIHNGPPHPSNYGYAYAKRMLDVQSRAYRQQYGRNFITAVPNNLYGENDNFHLENGHVIPALMHKIWQAKIEKRAHVDCWGDGSPLREFTYSVDIARILVFLLNNYNGEVPLNIGNTAEYSIKQVATLLCEHLDYDGELKWDITMPSGQYKKPSSNAKLVELGWDAEFYTPLARGLKNACEWFIINYPRIRGAGKSK
jgi:GDP-L-fucose synthase